MNRFVLLTCLASSVASSACYAKEAVIRRDVPVSAAGLDLASEQGLAMLDRRIKAAARAACGTAHPLDGPANVEMEQCRAEAVHRAYEQFGVPRGSGRGDVAEGGSGPSLGQN